MRKRCSLCGGKLKNGLCTECGMDNRKTDDVYCHNVSADVPVEQKVKDNSARNQSQSRKQHVGFEKKNLKVVFYAAAALLVLVVFIAPEFNSDTNPELYNVETDVPDVPDIPAEVVETTKSEFYLFPEGKAWQEDLTAGLYVVGVDIPEGEYTISAPPGCVYQAYNVPEYCEDYVGYTCFGKAPDGIEELTDVPLFAGTLVRIGGYSPVKFVTRNGQIDSRVDRIENPLTEEVEISGEVVAGSDFPAGTYDIEATGEMMGTVIYEYGDVFHLSLMMNSKSGYQSIYSSEIYRNIVLPEGTTVNTGEITVRLIPSKGIVNEDYTSFYGNTI